jgi:DNA-binding XRE family transcriptional regulator
LLVDGTLTQKTIGSQFNVSRETISSIKNGRRWQEVIILPNKTVDSIYASPDGGRSDKEVATLQVGDAA